MRNLLLTVLIATACVGFTPTSAAAAPAAAPSIDLGHPRVMQEEANRVATAPVGPQAAFQAAPPRSVVTGTTGRPVREVFGFALASSLSDPMLGYTTWDFSLVSTAAFFGLHVQDDGTLAQDSGWAVWNSSQLTGLLSTAHAHGARVVVTIILQDFSASTPHMCAGLMHGTATANYIAAEVRAKGVDGVNLDYEGLNGSCGTADPSWAQHDFTNFTGLVRSLLPAGSYLSVDTYASSASDPLGFFDIPGLNAHVDSFFVMAYDLEYSNWRHAPPGCVSFCLGPTAPLSGYYYNDTSTAGQYVSVVGPSKVILGVPYYGRKSCVSSATPNQYPTSGIVADSELDAFGEAAAPEVQPGSYAGHRDANDPAGQERWDTWFNTTLNCTRELYWDDDASLGQKYALVNADNLRGVGIWTLNYGGGLPGLWSKLNTYFSCTLSINLPASEATTQFAVPVATNGCAVAFYEVQQMDSTLNQAWFPLTPVVGASGSAVAQGYPNHAYQFRARSHSSSGLVSSWAVAGTTVAGTATASHPFAGMYTLDVFGGVNAADSPPLAGSAYWPGWAIARSARALPGASSPQSGAVLDGFGGLHSYGAPIATTVSAYWSGWDIARDFAFLPNGSGGVVLDGWGGLHPFHVNGSTAAITVQGNSYWPGLDIARKVVIFVDGTGGYVMDAYGGLHPFGINGPPPVSKMATTGYWPGVDVARDIVLVPGDGNHAGYVLDESGGLHPFHPTTDASTMPAAVTTTYWRGWDIARGIWLLPGSGTAGYTLDGYGGLHPFGGAPPIVSSSYWMGQDVARGLWGG